MTLIEIIVVVAIIAVLTALAVPSYQRYAQRGHRADAIRELLEMVACQGRIRAETGYYDSNRCLAQRNNDHYHFRIEPAGQDQLMAFRVIASPSALMAGDNCGDLDLNQAGSRGISGEPERLAACWGGR
jgi:type IV pilus assembly protein PilE